MPFPARRFLIPALLLAVFVLVPAAALILFPDRVLEEMRPWLERVASDRLEARVRIGSLSVYPLGSGRLRVTDLNIEREGAFRLDIPRLEAGFTLAGLLARRLETLRLEEPAAAVDLRAGEEEPWPTRLPLAIRRLEVTGGRAEVQGDGQPVRLAEVELTGGLADRSPFRVSARLGGGEGIRIAAAGTAVWGEVPAVTLEEAFWGERPLLAAPLTVSLPTGSAAGALRLDRFDDEQLAALLAALERPSLLPAGWSFELRAPEIRFRFEDGGLQAHLQAPEAILAAGNPPAGWSFELRAPDVRFRLRDGTLQAQLLIPEATAVSGDLTLPLHDVEAEAGGRDDDWQGSGTFRLEGAPGRLAGHWSGEGLSGSLSLAMNDPMAVQRRLLGEGLPALTGGLDLESTFTFAEEGARIEGKLQGHPGRPVPGALLNLAPLAAEVTAARPAGGAWTGRGRLSLHGRERILIRGTAERLQLELRPAAGAELLELLPASLGSVLPAGSEGIAGTAELVRGRSGGWGGAVRLRAARVPLPGGDLRQIEFRAPFAFGTGTLVGPAELTADLQGAGASAALAAVGSGRMQGEDFSIHLDRFALTDLEFAAADGLSALTGGRLGGAGTIIGRRGGESVEVALSAAAGVREVLRGPFYADLSPLSAKLDVRGIFDTGAARLRTERLILDLPGVGRAELRGEFATASSTVDGTVILSDLAAIWEGPLGRGLAGIRPDFAGLKPAGTVEADLSVRQENAGWRLAGEARPQSLDLLWPELRFSVRGLGGRFPFDLRSAVGADSAGEVRRGRLQVPELRLGPAVLVDAAVTLAASPNRFEIESPLLFEVAGGQLEAAETAAALSPGGVEAAARVRLREIDLGRLTREMGWTEMAGGVSADLGRIRYAGGNLAADGAMAIDAFGGKIQVGGLRLESLFSDYISLQADIDFSGIDLYQLTRTFEFGEINGIADGYVRDLRLFGTVPSAFDAALATRERGRRNISVKALNNLSIISQGGFSAVLSRGIYRFIDFYRYRKIGFACSLHNDVFTLRGTARPDSDRYLVYGGILPPKIDVVASAHTISFKEMLRRLERIERAE